jgi:hypothetical protein
MLGLKCRQKAESSKSRKTKTELLNGVHMGKIISIGVFCARRDREGPWTEEDAARQRDITEWQRNKFNPNWLAELSSKRSKPPAQPGSKAKLKVVKRRQP